jgi:Domain of unknown function (DUF397)
MKGTDARWRKSTYSGANGGGCLEAGNGHRSVLVRDTTNRPGGTLRFTPAAWKAFTARMKRSLTEPRPGQQGTLMTEQRKIALHVMPADVNIRAGGALDIATGQCDHGLSHHWPGRRDQHSV